MESKFIIFLVFAGLAQGVYVPRLSVSYGLSRKESTVLNQIINRQEAKRKAYINAFNALFDIIENLATELIFNRKPKTPLQSFDLNKPFTRLKNSSDISLDSIVLALGKSCSAVTLARNATHDYLDDALTQVTGALKLVVDGKYSENRDAIEVYQDAAQDDFTDSLDSVYNSVYTCLGTIDDDTSAVIEDFQNKSGVSFVRANNAFFNAMKLYAVAVTAGHTNMTLVSDIENCRNKAKVGLTADVENQFGLYKTLYLNSRINQDGIFRKLALNQYAVTASYDKYKEAIEILFETVRNYLNKPAFGLYADGENDFSRNDIAYNTLIVKRDLGDQNNLNSILEMYPNSNSAIADAYTELSNINYALNGDIFDLIRAAAAAVDSEVYSDTLEVIKDARDSGLSSSLQHSARFFTLIRNNRTWTDEGEAEFTALQNLATSSVTNVINQIFDAIETLASCILAGQVTDKDYSAIQNGLDTSISGSSNFTQALSAAGVLALKEK